MAAMLRNDRWPPREIRLYAQQYSVLCQWWRPDQVILSPGKPGAVRRLLVRSG
jgi:hypothetical protein